MTALPPEVNPDDTIAVEWNRDDFGTTVTISLNEATIKVECSHDAVNMVPFLAAALPNILEAAWAAIEHEEKKA